MARVRTASIVLAAASATAICASQTPGAAGPLTINGGSASGGVATLDVARRVLVTTAGNETGKTLTVTGTDRNGNPIREVLVLPNAATVYSAQDFLTVTSAVISAAAAGAITVGTNGVASTAWMPLDLNVAVFNAGIGVNFNSVTASVSVEMTLDDPNKAAVDSAPGGNADSSAAGLPYSTWTAPVPFTLTGGQNLTSDTALDFSLPSRAVRLTVNSGATSPGVRISVAQAGVWG